MGENRLEAGLDWFDSGPMLVQPIVFVFIGCMVTAVAIGPAHMPWLLLLAIPLLIFGAWSLAAFLRMATGGPVLVLDEDGLRHVSHGRVRWEDVLGLDLEWTFNGKYLVPCLHVALEEGAMPQDRSPLFSPLALNPMRISLRGLHPNASRIHGLALELRDRVAPPRLAGWRAGMRREATDLLRAERDFRLELAARRQGVARTQSPVPDLALAAMPTPKALLWRRARQAWAAVAAVGLLALLGHMLFLAYWSN